VCVPGEVKDSNGDTDFSFTYRWYLNGEKLLLASEIAEIAAELAAKIAVAEALQAIIDAEEALANATMSGNGSNVTTMSVNGTGNATNATDSDSYDDENTTSTDDANATATASNSSDSFDDENATVTDENATVTFDENMTVSMSPTPAMISLPDLFDNSSVRAPHLTHCLPFRLCPAMRQQRRRA
jgi:hypothetical protein